MKEMSAAELREIAKAKYMPGAWKAKKSEMIAYLESIGYSKEAQNEPELTEDSKLNKISTNEENSPEPAVEHSEEKPQDKPYGTLDEEVSNLSAKEEKAPEQPQNAPKSNLRGYAAWVVDRETKEITTIVGEADSREDFYNSIKTQYRVRLITKPEKIEDECKQWEIKHAQNKLKKNEKYAADKVKAANVGMTVVEYRKHLREVAKKSK